VIPNGPIQFHESLVGRQRQWKVVKKGKNAEAPNTINATEASFLWHLQATPRRLDPCRQRQDYFCLRTFFDVARSFASKLS
jgi:hypothetical protein